MNKKYLSLLFLPLAFAALTGCNEGDTISEIELDEVIPTAYVGEVFDLNDCFISADGFTYSADVYSYHGATYTETKLDCDGLTFTPITKDPISVVLHATKGDVSLVKTFPIEVEEKGDPLEELLINTGASGYADPGFQKALTKQVAYMRPGDDNKTAIAVSYSGNDNYYAGGAVFCPNNFRCLDYFTDKTWENAILKFWVYNDSDYDINFALRIKDEYTNAVDIDMTQPGNPTIPAAPHEWTEIKFALRPLGVTHTLYQNEEGTRNDSFTIKANWSGVRYTNSMADLILHPVEYNNYNFYVDGIDIVPASDYPDIDTNLPDQMDRYIVTQAWCEDAFTRSYNYLKTYVKEEGDSSIKYDFNGSINYNGTQGMCLNSPVLADQWSDTKWENAFIKFWIYNDSNKVIKMQLRVFDSVLGFDIDWGNEFNEEKVAEPGQWTLVLFSLNKIGINRLMYKDAVLSDEITVKFLCEKTNYTFYIDGVDVVDHNEYPEVDTTRVVPIIEALSDGLENLPLDEGWQIGTISNDEETICTKNYEKSVLSKKVVLNKVNGRSDPQDFVLAPEFRYGNDKGVNLNGKRLEFDLKFSNNIANKEVTIKLIQGGTEWATTLVQTITPTEISDGDGWYHACLDCSQIPEASAFTQTIRIGFYFNEVDDTVRGNDTFVNFDNIFVK